MDNRILKIMGKPGAEVLSKFREIYYKLARSFSKEQHLSYYLIAAHPGCTARDMEKVKSFSREKLGINPRQVQIFTPTPSTYSSLMYWTEKDSFTGEPMFVEKSFKGRENQKNAVVGGEAGIRK